MGDIPMEQERPTLTIHDEKIHYRCPQLGDTIPFSYCRRMNGGLPCRQIYTCWMDKLDVNGFIFDNFSLEEIERAFNQPTRGRMASLFETLNRVCEEKHKNKNFEEG